YAVGGDWQEEHTLFAGLCQLQRPHDASTALARQHEVERGRIGARHNLAQIDALAEHIAASSLLAVASDALQVACQANRWVAELDAQLTQRGRALWTYPTSMGRVFAGLRLEMLINGQEHGARQAAGRRVGEGRADAGCDRCAAAVGAVRGAPGARLERGLAAVGGSAEPRFLSSGSAKRPRAGRFQQIGAAQQAF